MTRYLIINADDLGYPMGTVEAITDLFERGIVTSSSAMVNQPDWPRAAACLREHPEWDVGVHLVMNEGQPVLPPQEVPALVDRQGCFRDGWPLLLRYLFLSLSQLRAEWQAQIEKFIANTGRPPSHLDLHCHYPYVFPAWFRLSVELAETYGCIPLRMPFDDALEQKAPELSVHYGGFPVWMILRWGRRYQEMVSRRGLTRPNYFESSFTQDGHRTAERLIEILERLPEGITELLCHPGTEDWRLQDYQALNDPRVRQQIEALDITLIGYHVVEAERG